MIRHSANTLCIDGVLASPRVFRLRFLHVFSYVSQFSFSFHFHGLAFLSEKKFPDDSLILLLHQIGTTGGLFAFASRGWVAMIDSLRLCIRDLFPFQ